MDYRCNDGATVLPFVNKLSMVNGDLEWVTKFDLPQNACPRGLQGRTHTMFLNTARLRYQAALIFFSTNLKEQLKG